MFFFTLKRTFVQPNHMDLKLEQKVALVTGASGGIGSAIAQMLALEGANIGVVYFKNAEKGEEIVRDICKIGRRATALQADVRSANAVQQLFHNANAFFGGIDILINCAGIAYFHPLDQYNEQDWDTVVDTNLKGAFLCCREALPYFRARGGGDIVNISSLAGLIGSFEGVAYASSKAGMNQLTHSLALELAQENIRVNGIAPGRIMTAFRRTHAGEYFDFMLEQTPQKRMGTIEEVARAVAFLASRASSFITGETLSISGGLQTVYLKHVTPDPDSKLNRTTPENAE